MEYPRDIHHVGATVTGRFCFVLLLVVIAGSASAQENFLYTYDAESKSIDSVLLEEPAEWIAQATPSAIGLLNNHQPLPVTVPDDSLVQNETTRLFAAREQFDITSYPVRCASSMRVGPVDTTRHACSAVLVGDRWALTAAHCVMTFQSPPYRFVNRETFIAPVWDEGAPGTQVGPTRVVRMFVVRDPNRSVIDNDVALLELEEPIGKELGWVGLYTAPPVSWVNGELVHRLSYPAGTDLKDTTQTFDGNDLMCRQGFLETITPRYVRSQGVFGIPGESGSPAIRAWMDGYVTTGVVSFASGLNTRVLESTTFSAFEKVMYGPTASVPDPAETTLRVFPNPARDLVNIEGLGESLLQRVDVFDVTGQRVMSKQDPVFSCEGLVSGSYHLIVVTSSGRIHRSLSVVR